jgi:hypothetical protein
MKRALFSLGGIAVGIIGWVVTSACTTQTIVTPVRSFDRPSDVALVCAEFRTDNGLYDVHNLTECNPDTLPQQDMGLLTTQPFLGPGEQVQFVMALVAQSARGEVALVDASRDKLVSLQPKLPGFGFLPVGALPEHIRATPDSCRAVTSNTDSCDYAIIDVPTAINGAIPPGDLGAAPQPSQTNVVRRIVAAVPDGNGGARVLPARPGWIEIAPDTVASTHGYEPGGKPGQCVGGSHKAWVALPACELLVKLDLDWTPGANEDPTQPMHPTVEQAIKITKAGVQVVTDLSSLSCPSECIGVGSSDGGAVDLMPPPPSDMGNGASGAGDGGTATGDLGAPPIVNRAQAYPGTIAIDRDGGRMIVGDLFGERIDIIPLDNLGNIGTPASVQLEPGAGGVTVVRASRRSYAGQFVYAIARDGTVRVVDLDRQVECETNPDPRFVGNGINLQDPSPPIDPTPQARQLGCFPLGDPSTPPRAWYATSPGITLNYGQLPRDISFVHVDLPPGVLNATYAPPAAAPGVLVGDFAWIFTSNGQGQVVQIFDGCPQPNQQDLNAPNGPFTPECWLGNANLSRSQSIQEYGHPTPLLLDRLAHRMRGGHLRFAIPQTASDNTGMARIADEFNPFGVSVPSTSAVDAGVAQVDGGASPNLPGLYQEALPTSLIGSIDTAPTRVIRFVDPDRAKTELWSASWEGLVPGTQRTLGQWLPGGYLTDNGGAWCAKGVEAGDKLIYSGCIQDGDCDYAITPTGASGDLGVAGSCVHDPAAPSDVLNGLCLPIDNIKYTVDYWSQRCGPLLRAQRKYHIVSARQQQPLPSGVPAPPPPGTQPGGGAATLPTDWLKLAEIYEPEHPDETKTCMSDADCINVTVAPASGAEGGLATRCLADFDGVNRCLLGCVPNVDDTGSPTPRCGSDFECARSTLGDLRCLRAPLDDQLFAECFPELQSYEIHAGESFLVQGVTSGFVIDEQPNAVGECTVPPLTNEFARLHQSRIPLDPPSMCTFLPTPGETTTTPLDSIDHRTLHDNVCQVTPQPGMITPSRIIHWENGIFNIAMVIPVDADGNVIVPPDGTSVSWDLVGGGTFLAAPIGVDVQAADLRYSVVGPDGQTVYIVDQGKSNTAAGLRGQLLRLFTPTQTTDHLFVIR